MTPINILTLFTQEDNKTIVPRNNRKNEPRKKKLKIVQAYEEKGERYF